MNTNDVILLIIAICALVSIGLFITFFIIDFKNKNKKQNENDNKEIKKK